MYGEVTKRELGTGEKRERWQSYAMHQYGLLGSRASAEGCGRPCIYQRAAANAIPTMDSQRRELYVWRGTEQVLAGRDRGRVERFDGWYSTSRPRPGS